ncbi:trans-cinnamate:CoA ligase, peroxisomal-like [Aristolochia californica]|uniref:trans-cinnamate:CoA ligase, peroxisomal-like n=1 Tax=Aristolochia californica TaxID=171875 RepID=UPI0035E2DF02
MEELIKCEANYLPLSPVTFLERAAVVYSSRTSVVYGHTSFTWGETYERARRLASALLSLDVAKNDVVSVLAPNVPALYEMHFAVPMAGAVLNTINTRLDYKTVATILKHSGAKILFVDHEYVPLACKALELLRNGAGGGDPPAVELPLVVLIDEIGAPTRVRICEIAIEYEELIRGGDPCRRLPELGDEWDPIALNYTSGTTSAPKGVVYSHRGAYLSTLSLLLQWEVGSEPVYLWSLPMFHCNGWTFTWGMAARGGTNVCIRSPNAADMYRAIADHRVTHMCGVPFLFNVLLNAQASERRPVSRPVQMLTGGAPPPAKLLEKMEKLGFHVTHAYGMTEATGPALVCEWREEWDRLSAERRAQLKARQGVSVLTLSEADVKNPKTMESVPRDGRTMGEIVLRGSSLMKGYFKDPSATEKVFAGGWLWTGDVGVMHPDGYVEIKDRSKDVIISGGENISSVEVENTVYTHPAVAEVAVVAMPSEKWGESPCAFVVLHECTKKKTELVTEEDIIAHCKNNMPHFMTPKKVVFLEALPKSSNSKVLKFQLRALAKALCNSTQKTAKPSRQTHRSQSRSSGIYGSHETEILARSRL